MNIGFVLIPYQRYSGVGEYYRSLFKHLLEFDQKNTYTVFLPCDAGEEAYEYFGRERCVKTGIPSSPSHIRYPKTIFQDSTIEEYRPRIDVLHCFNFPTPRFSGKIVLTIHDLREDDLPEFFNPVINRIRRKVVQKNLIRADALIAVSDFTLGRLLYHYPFCAGKATRVYHGIHQSLNRNITSPRLHPRPYILTVGHMYPYKSHRNLLLAFNRLIQHPDFYHNLIVVGGSTSRSSYYQEIQNLVGDKQRVVFTGVVSYNDLSSYYANADLFVFPSLYEGFGFPMFEALSYNVPVAVSDIEVFNELLHSSETYFDPYNPADIEKVIYKIIKDPKIRERILIKGKERLLTFTWMDTARKTLSVYERVIQEQPNKKILFLTRYDRLGASSRLRSYQYFPFLKDSGFDVSVFPLFNENYVRGLYSGNISSLSVFKAYIDRIQVILRGGQYDLMYLEYEMLPWLPDWVEFNLLPEGVPVVVDYDDAIFHRYDHHRFAFVRRLLGNKIDNVMRRATLVIVGNEYLSARARLAGAQRIELLPTVVDINRYSTMEKKDPSRVTIGWIGSPTTAQYLKIVEHALREMIALHNVRVVAVGARTSQLQDMPIEVRPWSEETEAAEIEQFDIGIMPLPDNLWEKGKCGYKLIQYMASGKPVVASPVGVNCLIVQQGINGFLANTKSEWCKALGSLCKDASLRKRMGEHGRKRMEEDYSIQVVAPRFVELLRSVVKK